MVKYQEMDFYPLEGQPYFDNERFWISPMNFIAENLQDYPEKVILHGCTLPIIPYLVLRLNQ